MHITLLPSCQGVESHSLYDACKPEMSHFSNARVSSDYKWLVFDFTSMHYLLTVSLITIWCSAAMTFNWQLRGRRTTISFEASTCPGDRQRDEWRQAAVGLPPPRAFIMFLKHRHVSMIKYFDISTCNLTQRCQSKCNTTVMDPLTISVRPQCWI